MLAKGAPSLQHINNARCKSKHPDNATALPPAEHSETATPMAYKHTAMQSGCERWGTPDVMTVKELLSFYLNTPTPWGEKSALWACNVQTDSWQEKKQLSIKC